MFTPADEQPSNSEVVTGRHPLSAASPGSPSGAGAARPARHVDPAGAASVAAPGATGSSSVLRSSSGSGSGAISPLSAGGGGGGSAAQQRALGSVPSATSSSPGDSYVFVGERGESTYGASSSAVRRAASDAAVAGEQPQIAYAKFKIGAPRLGNETLKPLTYFPITVTVGDVALNKPGAHAIPELAELPRAPYHTLGGTLKARAPWQAPTAGGNECGPVERRYSEFTDFRQLLVMLYPMLLIPPLPAKSQADSINTYFGNTDSLRHQRLALLNFCRGLATIPEVILFCKWVPPFFQLPRDESWVQYMGTIREMLATLRTAMSPIFAQSTMQQSGSLVDQTGALVKTVVNSVWGWFGGSGGGGGAASAGGATSRSKGELQTAIDHKVAQMLQYERHMTQIRALNTARDAYRVAAAEARRWIELEEGTREDLKAISQACGDYGLQTLAGCDEFKNLSDVLTLEASLTAEIVAAHERENHRRLEAIVEALFLESSWAESVVEQLDLIIAFWKRDCELAIDARGSREAEAFNKFCSACNDRIEEELVNFHQLRQRRLRLLQRRLVLHSLEHVDKEIDATRQHALVKAMEHPDFAISQRFSHRRRE